MWKINLPLVAKHKWLILETLTYARLILAGAFADKKRGHGKSNNASPSTPVSAHSHLAQHALNRAKILSSRYFNISLGVFRSLP